MSDFYEFDTATIPLNTVVDELERNATRPPWLRNDGSPWPDLTIHKGWTNANEGLKNATIWWVSTNMAQLVDVAIPSLPDYTLALEDIPDAAGVAFLETPIRSPVGSQIHALSWLSFKAIGWTSSDEKNTGSVLSAWQRTRCGKWRHGGAAVWQAGTDFKWTPTGLDVDLLPEGADDFYVWVRQTLATAWLLSTQANVAEVEEAQVTRATARRLSRSGRPVPLLRKVYLRRPKAASHGDGDGGEVDYSHRWMVSGHWRNQAYGPGQSRRKPMWIAPHIKGPEDKPLVMKTTVKVLDR